jgi:CRISPR/Cas system-associated exonuclease Cas4 (RecB family)
MAKGAGILRPCLEHEVALTGTFKQHKLKAKVDLVIEMRGGVGIIDWKTGNADRKNLMQLALYAMLYTKKSGRKVDWIVPFYTKIRNVVYQPFDSAIIAEAGVYFRNTYEAMASATTFPAVKGPGCYFCDLSRDGCPLSKRFVVSV